MNKDNRDSHLIFFGNKQDALFLKDIQESRFSFELQNLIQDYGLQKFIALDQVHGPAGFVVDEKTLVSSAKWFDVEADFIITNQKNIGLVVLTADCIPLILYDSVAHAIGVVHAGWKGSYLGVLPQALQAMKQTYGTDVKNLKCTFGPSAKSCCYEVSQSFVQDFEQKYPGIAKFDYTNLKYYFDNGLFLQQVLKKFGIAPENIYTDNVLCTICNPEFCSFRREKEQAKRQVTLVALF